MWMLLQHTQQSTLPSSPPRTTIHWQEVAIADTLSIYSPKGRKTFVKELAKIARKHGRSVNYIVVKAIEAYVEKENGWGEGSSLLAL
jgi:hypothetical protein